MSSLFSAATESEWSESLHRKCGQEAGYHGPADQVDRSDSFIVEFT